jgi:hypothetical protein
MRPSGRALLQNLPSKVSSPYPATRHATRPIPAMPSALKRFGSVTRVYIGCLPLGVSRGDLLAEGFEAVHSRLDPASHVTADQSFHVARPKRLLARRMSFGGGGGAVFLSQASVSGDRDDGRAATIQDCGLPVPDGRPQRHPLRRGRRLRNGNECRPAGRAAACGRSRDACPAGGAGGGNEAAEHQVSFVIRGQGNGGGIQVMRRSARRQGAGPSGLACARFASSR